jgi:retron-type reverse transcriptase
VTQKRPKRLIGRHQKVCGWVCLLCTGAATCRTPTGVQAPTFLQKLLVRATSTKLLAIRRVTQENQGKHTAGVDGVVCATPEARLQLFQEGLSLMGYRPRPVRRVYIPKSNGKRRPLGIPTVKDRVTTRAV